MESVMTPVGAFDLDEPMFSLRDMIPFLSGDTSMKERGLYGTLMLWLRFGMEPTDAMLSESSCTGRHSISSTSRSLQDKGYLSITREKREDGMCTGRRVWETTPQPKPKPIAEPSGKEKRRQLSQYLDMILGKCKTPSHDVQTGFPDTCWDVVAGELPEIDVTPVGDVQTGFPGGGSRVGVVDVVKHQVTTYKRVSRRDPVPAPVINEHSLTVSGTPSYREGLPSTPPGPLGGLSPYCFPEFSSEKMDVVKVVREAGMYSFVSGTPRDAIRGIAGTFAGRQDTSEHMADQRRVCEMYLDVLSVRHPQVSVEAWNRAANMLVGDYGNVRYASLYFTKHWRELVDYAVGEQARLQGASKPSPEAIAEMNTFA